MEIKLTLDINEVNALLATLGELPTKTGAWVLLNKIKVQAEQQSQPPAEAEAVPAPAQ